MRTLLVPLLLVPVLAAGQTPPPGGDSPSRPPRAFRPPGSARPATPAPGPQPAPPSPTGRSVAPPAGGAAGGGQALTEPVRPDARCVPLKGRFMLTFNKADIVDVLEQASRWTCRNFVYTDEVARGKINLLSKTPVTADEAYAAFLVALNTNNIAVYPTGRYYKLIRTADAKKNPIPLYTDPDSGTPASEQPITRVIRLQYADADQMRGIVANFVSPQGADVVAIPPDMLIVTDTGLNLRRIERILDAVDRQGSGDLVRIVQIRYAAAKDIADKVNQIFQAQGRAGAAKRTLLAPSPGAPAPGPAPGAGGAAAGGAVQVSVSKIIPDDRTNKLIVIADEKSFQRISELIEQLDVPATSGGGIHVVFLKNANAEEMAQTLSSLASGQQRRTTPGAAPTPAGQPARPGMPAVPAAAPRGSETAELFSGEVKITADKAQNALLIQASGTDFQAVSRLIEKLDRPRRQVFVEAVILEVNLRDQTQFGIGAHAAIPYTYKGDTAFIPLASEPGRVSSLNVGSAISLGGFLTGFVGPTSTELSKLGLNLPSLGLLIQALQTSSDVNVLSTPHLVATDNEESEITVGQNVPFQAGYSTGLSNLLTGAGATNNAALGSLVGSSGLSGLIAPIQRQNVDLKLKIKPQISEGGRVRLQIEEQTEEIASNDATLGPTTAKRSVKTQVVARDQSTIVIGGLIQERTVRSIKKVPILGSIPILGWLFRDTDTTKTKTNLLLFLTPYIIRDESDYRRIYERKRKEQQEFIEQFYGRQPRYDVPVDWARKAGPFTKIHAGVVEEASRVENGGRGAPGQRVTTPPGGPADEGAPPPSPLSPADGAPQDAVPPEVPPPGGTPRAPGLPAPAPGAEGAPVDRLEPQPEVPAPGEPPAGPQPGDAPAPPG